MTELQLTLDFACSDCQEWINITVQCTGKGLMAGPRTVAAVRVPCPCCGHISRVCFHPGGTVVAVEPVHSCHHTLEPSLN